MRLFRLIIQPNNLYAIWDVLENKVVLYNASPLGVMQYLTEHMRKLFIVVDGEGRLVCDIGTIEFNKAIRIMKKVHGAGKVKEVVDNIKRVTKREFKLIKQPNGYLGLWDEEQKLIILYDATREEVIECLDDNFFCIMTKQQEDEAVDGLGLIDFGVAMDIMGETHGVERTEAILMRMEKEEMP